MIEIAVYISAALMIVSKFLDCWTTLKKIKSPYQEKNPIARKLMLQLGTKTVILLIFLLSVIIVVTALLPVRFYDSTIFYQVAFVVIGLIISYVQFSVAHTNHTKRSNQVTRFLLKRY